MVLDPPLTLDFEFTRFDCIYILYLSANCLFFNFHRTWSVFQIFSILSDKTEFWEHKQAKLQFSALINVSRHINVYVNKKCYWRNTKRACKRASEWKTVWIKIRSDVLLGSDLDLNCLQRLSADDTSSHSRFLLSAGSIHPNITESKH